MTCSEKHVTYQKERRLTSPQKPLPSTPAKQPEPAKVGTARIGEAQL